MKKLKVLLLIVIALLVGIKGVNAESLKIEETDMYFYRIGKPKDYSGRLKKYIVNGRVGYCIEPGELEEGDYTVGSLDDYGLTDEQKRNIKLYAYYGYEYVGHKRTEYLAAAQSLIWKEILGQDLKVIFSSEVLGGGTIYNIEKYEKQIKNLAGQHDNMPSVANETYTVNVGEELVVNDYKNTLERYEVIDSLNVTTDRNKLIINKKDAKDETITLRRKPEYNYSYTVFKSTGQDMLMAGDFETAEYKVHIKVNPGSIKLTKVDSETKDKLGGAVYGLYDMNNNLITELTTNEEGTAVYSEFKENGKYYLKEIKAPEGYTLNEKKYEFELTDSKQLEITLDDNKIVINKEEPKEKPKKEKPKKEVKNELPENPKTYDLSIVYYIDLIVSIGFLIVLKHLWNFDKIK